MIMEDSSTAREAETDQSDSQTEARTVETRTGAGRETDMMRKREHETENLAETRKGYRQGMWLQQRQAVHNNAAAQQAIQY